MAEARRPSNPAAMAPATTVPTSSKIVSTTTMPLTSKVLYRGQDHVALGSVNYRAPGDSHRCRPRGQHPHEGIDGADYSFSRSRRADPRPHLGPGLFPLSEGDSPRPALRVTRAIARAAAITGGDAESPTRLPSVASATPAKPIPTTTVAERGRQAVRT